MSIFPQRVARVVKKLSCLKYYNALKREKRFILGHNADKNSYYMKKNLMWKLVRIQFLKKEVFKKKKNHSGTDM